jgi:hypothetical protein
MISPLSEIHIFDAKTQAFQQTQPAAVQQTSDEKVGAGELGQNQANFGPRQDDGQPFGSPGP